MCLLKDWWFASCVKHSLKLLLVLRGSTFFSHLFMFCLYTFIRMAVYSLHSLFEHSYYCFCLIGITIDFPTEIGLKSGNLLKVTGYCVVIL